MKVAFAGSFGRRMADAVRSKLAEPCEVIAADETDIVPRLFDVDVLVSMAFTARMAEAAPRLRLVQVPGAGLDRIDRGALRPGTYLANAYGHETGIAEYIIGAMIALTRSFRRLDASLRQGRWDSQWALDAPAPPVWPELAGKTLGILGFGHIGLGGTLGWADPGTASSFGYVHNRLLTPMVLDMAAFAALARPMRVAVEAARHAGPMIVPAQGAAFPKPRRHKVVTPSP